MNLYAFILGRKPFLSIAELVNVLPKDAHIVDIRREALIAALPRPLPEPQESLNRLGGTTKIAEIFAELPLEAANVSPAISSHLSETFRGHESKLSYGLSAYSFSGQHEKLVKKVLMEVKKGLKAEGINSRFINKNFRNPENAAIKGEKLIEKGAEIVIIKGAHRTYVGQTKALQDFESYSYRDYNRPQRDPRLGMLPPKLAQIMINLAGFTSLYELPDAKNVIFDPFVGIGTIITEALLQGYSVIGSDIEEDVLDKCQKNVEWTKERVYTHGQKAYFFAKDATTLTPKDLPMTPAAVVTESYLGPPLSRFPGIENTKKNFTHIRELVSRFFHAINPVIQKGTHVIISLPAYRDGKQFMFVENLIDKIEKTGFAAESPIPKDLLTKFSLPSHPRLSLIYDRPDQTVAREIWKFTKN